MHIVLSAEMQPTTKEHGFTKKQEYDAIYKMLEIKSKSDFLNAIKFLDEVRDKDINQIIGSLAIHETKIAEILAA